MDWFVMPFLNQASNERLGYPTQKPVALMERIINASSNEGDIIGDFFCGCGTTIAAAEKLKRQWIGADISHLAIKLISKRLIDTYGPEIRKTYEIFGFPKDIDSARELAITSDKGRFKFEEWIVEVMLHGVLNPKKTETGFDGYFTLDIQGKKDVVMIEVKSGNATITQLNHFIKTTESKGGHAGIFVCFADQVTRGMWESAKKQGYYRSEYFQSKYDKIQIMTVEDLMDGKMANLPSFENTTFKTAEKQKNKKPQQGLLGF
jgi:site-specific DNA-methyltransferase (adenine-specific)